MSINNNNNGNNSTQLHMASMSSNDSTRSSRSALAEDVDKRAINEPKSVIKMYNELHTLLGLDDDDDNEDTSKRLSQKGMQLSKEESDPFSIALQEKEKTGTTSQISRVNDVNGFNSNERNTVKLIPQSAGSNSSGSSNNRLSVNNEQSSWVSKYLFSKCCYGDEE